MLNRHFARDPVICREAANLCDIFICYVLITPRWSLRKCCERFVVDLPNMVKPSNMTTADLIDSGFQGTCIFGLALKNSTEAKSHIDEELESKAIGNELARRRDASSERRETHKLAAELIR